MNEDRLGFQRFCLHAEICWLKVSYCRYRARKGGPFPRRQDLRAGAYIKGSPPQFARKFVVSHAWASEYHPSPTGHTLKLLAHELDELGASDDDVVFLECVLPVPSSPQTTNRSPALLLTCWIPFRSLVAQLLFLASACARRAGRVLS